ncbi:MAG: branched-chain amino acid ABC transporter permease [SAR324 cluster bacterium]|uniref:Branched-chain amino acid ABC transporter permease n=1 Tax=SAR324 cluster bacterium TaxID=2024889 RepID=A0A2A4T8Z9_9DELT|nr:MAG: branched-chain amino acid ABC transporter permease [SAR324 cluster bacterium]
MSQFIQLVLNGIAAGSIYALMAMSLVIIYQASAVVNFAQGEMALLTAYLAFLLLEQGLTLPVAFGFSFLFSFFLGAGIEFGILRRARESTVISKMMITIGLEMVFIGLVSWKFGADPKTIDFPFSPYDSLMLGQDIFLSFLEAISILVALVVVITLYLFFRFTPLGIAMKASRQNERAARLMGIRTKRILMITWGISSLVGTIAASLLTPLTMHPYMMWNPLLKGFAAAVLGGMTSLPGALIGGYMIGIIENLFGGYLSIEFKEVVAFAMILLVLCLRPSGLFAHHYVKKV